MDSRQSTQYFSARDIEGKSKEIEMTEDKEVKNGFGDAPPSSADTKFKDEGSNDKELSTDGVNVVDPEKGRSFTLFRRKWNMQLPDIPARFRVAVEQDALNYSLWAVRFGVLADAANMTILEPNYPFMTQPGVHKDSFPDTDPFGFSAATYFIPMTAMLGGAFTCAFAGSLSDRIGRKSVLLVCVGMSVITTLIKYAMRDKFWTFCAANFANGLFGGTLPVGLAYASDIHPNRVKKDEEIGLLIGFNMIGRSGGGIVAILLESSGLFLPLVASAVINFAATVAMWIYMIEPDGKLVFEEDPEEDEGEAPEKINWWLFFNINMGALWDNVGSTGIYPLTMSPLAFEIFFFDFVSQVPPQDPIMSENLYRWAYILVALTVIPGAAFSQTVYKYIGPAGGCVVGNALTAVGIVACLYICLIEPPTRGTMIAFIITLYVMFPLTVLSQLSTGPMLDRISPVEKRGFSQGINITVMNFSIAITPYLLGTLADNSGIDLTLWVTVGISLLAVATNIPLMFAPELIPHEKKDYQLAHGLEDQDLVDRAMKGDWVPARFLMDLNDARRDQGMPFLVLPCRPYEENKGNLDELKRHAKEDFNFIKFRLYEYLNQLDTQGEPFVRAMESSLPSQEVIDKQAEDLGLWFGEYLKDTGYLFDGGHPVIMKQLIMKAFPMVRHEEEHTVESTEKMCLAFLKVLNKALDDGTKSDATRAFRNSVVM